MGSLSIIFGIIVCSLAVGTNVSAYAGWLVLGIGAMVFGTIDCFFNKE